MSKENQLEKSARVHSRSFKKEDFMGLLQSSGWEHLKTNGQHQIWTSTEGVRFVATADKSGIVPEYQVKEFLANLDRERVTALMRSFKVEFSKQNSNPEVQRKAESAFMRTMEKTFGEGRVPNPIRNKANAHLIDKATTKSKDGVLQKPNIERA